MIIRLKDGSEKEYAQPMSVLDIAKDISEGLARNRSEEHTSELQSQR